VEIIFETYLIADLEFKQKVLIALSLLIAKFSWLRRDFKGNTPPGNPSRYLPFLGSQTF